MRSSWGHSFPFPVPVQLLPRYQRIQSYALSALPLPGSKLNHEITGAQNSPCHSNRDTSGNGLHNRPGQPVSNPGFRYPNADVLLPLRAWSRREAMREDV